MGTVAGIEQVPSAAPRVDPFTPGAALRAGSLRRDGEAREAHDELDLEIARLLRVRSGELAEPLLWARPSFRAEVVLTVEQLAPIRSRIALLSSWSRESRRDGAVRVAYAIVWLRLAQRRAGEYGARTRASRGSLPGSRLVRA